ncbi:MAG: type II CAAX endopeptidase family protein [Acidobacteriota bacterium]
MEVAPHARRPEAAERWLQIATFTLLTLAAAAQLMAPPPAPVDDQGTRPPSAEVELQGRYLLGLHTLGAGGGPQLSQGLDALLDAANSPPERLRLTALAVAIGNREWAEARIDEARVAIADGELSAAAVAPFERLIAPEVPAPGVPDIEGVASGQPIPGDIAATLAEEHGWFGELTTALARGESQAVRSAALRTAAALFGLAILGLAVLAAGTGLSVFAYSKWRSGALSSGYRRDTETGDAGPIDPSPDGWPGAAGGEDRTPYLETVLLAIIGLQVLGAVAVIAMGGIDSATSSRWPLLINWLLLPVLMWPLARGHSRPSFTSAIGWHRGRGPLVEIGCGLLGYVSAAPLLIFGFLCSAFVASFLDTPPHHPILDWVQGAGWLELALVVSVAVLWAPVVEESLFRGVFYHYLRGRSGPVLSALVVSLAFAAIHPQGWAGIPFLISLAVTLALVREWRGSLIAPMTVHLVHNGLVMTLLLTIS